MVIKKIEINNFRCYYGVNTFEFDEGLTLIVGGNGDGKTTFFEALEWLFEVVDPLKKNQGTKTTYISKKRLREMSKEEKDKVSISFYFEHDGSKQLHKTFEFIKRDDSSVELLNFEFIGYEDDNHQRVPVDGTELLERCFDASIRKYCLFKGESNLNVFDSKDALHLLVNTYSNVRNFEPYIKFSKFARNRATEVYKNQAKNDSKSRSAATKLSNELENIEKELESIDSNLKIVVNDVTNYEELLEKIERNKELSEYYNDTLVRIEKLEKKKRDFTNRIKDNYPIRLLDEKWILCGFVPILEEFKGLVSKVSKAKRKVEDDYERELGKNEAIKSIQDNLDGGKITPLALYVPDEESMKEMIEDEYCKVCGRRAEKNSEPYNFMVNKLREFLDSQKSTEKKELFAYDHIGDLDKIKIHINYQLKELNSLIETIEDDVRFNTSRQKDLNKIQEDLDIVNDTKQKILIQADGVSEDELKSIFYKSSEYWKSKEKAIIEQARLESEKKRLTSLLNVKQEELRSLAKNTNLEVSSNISFILQKIYNAFIDAKDTNTDNLISEIENKSNIYLSRLNEGDFKGVIQIIKLSNGSAKFELVDRGGESFDANTALETTVNMAVLFAISELSALKRDNNYPLIFDAPTSSFQESKEKDFFNIISSLDKQCIIVTKSFLKEVNGQKSILDIKSLEGLKAKIYQISKKEPFEDTDVSTIETQISCIKK